MSQRSSSSSASRQKAAFGMSSYSINKSGPLTRVAKTNLKEELIAKKITEIFKEKENRMIRTIEQTILDDKMKIYKMKRSDFEEELTEIEKERTRIIKRKKNKKERLKALRTNSRQQLYYLVKALNETVQHYKTGYFENDFYRLQRLLNMSRVEKTQSASLKTVQEFLNNLFHSAFKDDRRFMIKYMAVETRDRLNESRHLVDSLFFDKIFKLMLGTSDEQNTLQAYEIICNLLKDDHYRAKLRDNGYIRQIFQSIDLDKIEERKLEKISHMVTLIAFHSDMLQRILETRLLQFIIKLADAKYSVTIRSNAVLAISLLTYHETLFHELISNNVIDMVMNMCMDPKLEISIKRFSTLALVHFALSRESINILLEKGVMDLFNALSLIDNAQIYTNVSWIFLALCNNGITGKQMLLNGITRDMFLVSCNPQFSQIRHLVIAGFAELGRADNLQEHSVRPLPQTLQRIKEKAIVGTQEAYQVKDAANTIDVLLRFTLSCESQFKLTAFWALKDYILLNNECLVDDLSGVIQAFVNGAAENSDKVKAECSNAISFLITHHLVFTEVEAKRRQESSANATEYQFNKNLFYILDALMYLTGQESLEVRTRAFSTLSSLSTYASSNDYVMAQIQHDIKMQPDSTSKDYFAFIENRLAQSQQAFRQKYETENIEKDYAGLYCLLRLAQEPDEAGTEEAARLLRQFYFPEKNFKVLETKETLAKNAAQLANQNDWIQQESHQQTLMGTGTLSEKLTDAEKRALSVNMFNDELDERELKLDHLNEKFFMYVFKALLYTQNRRILYQLLDVINFYIKHETPYQQDVINPSSILWMLKIIDTHKEDADLCLLAAKTVLKVVNNHQIVFDYQEMAIIKKFNKALDNIGNVRQHVPDTDTLRTTPVPASAPSEAAQTIIDRETPELHSLTLDDVNKESTFKKQMLQEQALSEKAQQAERVQQQIEAEETKNVPGLLQKLEHAKQGTRDQPTAPVSIKRLQTKMEEDGSELQSHPEESFDSQKFQQEIESYSKHSSRKDNNSQKDILEESVASLHKLRSNSNIAQIEQDAKQAAQEELQQKSRHEAAATERSFEENSPSVHSKKNPHSVVSPSRRIFGSAKALLKFDSNGHVVRSKDAVIDQIDEKQSELRDTIIKSFMVIFTNEKSQHLLLNKDIIDIAFSCLENVCLVTKEAKRNLARLMSIIFKFPQVQERLLSERVILGIVYLLQGPDIENETIMCFLVTACSYISLNFKFVNSKLSIHILQALIPIMARLLSNPEPRSPKLQKQTSPQGSPQKSSQSLKNAQILGAKGNKTMQVSPTDAYLEQRLQSHITTPIDLRNERDNCVFAISNLLKGHPQNVQFFTQVNASQMILIEIMRIQDVSSAQAKEISELLSSCMKEVAYSKPNFRMFLSLGDENLNLLLACLEKCFSISDSWHTCTSEIILFKKLYIDGEKHYEGENTKERESRLEREQKMKRLDSDQILNIDYKNIEKMKLLEKLEEKEDKSFAMAPLCKLRNHCYSIAASCMLNNFSMKFLFRQCQLLERVTQDLIKDDKNDFIFQSLLEILRTIKKDPQAIFILFQNYGMKLIELIRSMQKSTAKRNSLFTTLVYLMLKAPQEMVKVDQAFIGAIFALTSDIDDDDIKENLLWLQSAIIEVNTSDEQHANSIDLCTEFKSAQTYLECLKSTNEIIVLQAIKGLKTLAAIPQFKAIILIDIGDELFMHLAQILGQRLSQFTECPLEIEVELVGFLAQITESSAATKDPLTIAAKRRAVQQGFTEHYLQRISQLEYKVLQDIDILNENCQEIANLDLWQVNSGMMDQILRSGSDHQGLDSDEIRMLSEGGDFEQCRILDDYDRIEREEGTNTLIECTMQLAANVTELAETHEELVNGRGQVLKQSMALMDAIVKQCIEVESEQVELINYSIGNRDMCNYLSKLTLNLCLAATHQQPGMPSMQDLCVANGVGAMMVHVCRSIVDYELHSNLYRAMCLLAMSPNADNRKHFVESDCLNEVQQAAENNRFFRVRRTCTRGMDQFASELFKMNEKMMRKRKRLAKRRTQQSRDNNANGSVTNTVQITADSKIVNIS